MEARISFAQQNYRIDHILKRFHEENSIEFRVTYKSIERFVVGEDLTRLRNLYLYQWSRIFPDMRSRWSQFCGRVI